MRVTNNRILYTKGQTVRIIATNQIAQVLEYLGLDKHDHIYSVLAENSKPMKLTQKEIMKTNICENVCKLVSK